MIKIKDLTKKWKDFKINHVNLEINDNEYFVILGPSGAGKTMLLELIAGIWNNDSGKVYLNNKDITDVALEKREIGFVYQNYMLFPHKTVFENISFGLNLRKLGKKEIEKNVTEMMKLLGISHLADRLPRTLSGGEQQRTAIARALIVHPKVLLMDEPLSALDRKIKEDLMDELKDIHEKFDITIVQVTHNFDEALILADRIAIMKKGEISQVGTVDEIFRNPKSEFVADFVGVKNIFKGTGKINDKKILEVNTEHITIYSTKFKEGSIHVTIRPEDIILSINEVKTSARNVFKGPIKKIMDEGALIKLTVDVGEEFIVYLTRQSFLDMELNIGKEVWIYIKATAVNVF
jgi:molybdate/tungstate transport system ATP-binding protein